MGNDFFNLKLWKKVETIRHPEIKINKNEEFLMSKFIKMNGLLRFELDLIRNNKTTTITFDTNIKKIKMKLQN